MNHCLGRKLTVFAVVIISAATTVRAADDPQSQPVARALQDKAAPARRSQLPAAALAEQAAAFADDGQSDSANTGSANTPATGSMLLESHGSVCVADYTDGVAPAATQDDDQHEHQHSREAKTSTKDKELSSATADHSSTSGVNKRKSTRDEKVKLASRAVTDSKVHAAIDQEPTQQLPAANRGSNSAQDGYIDGGRDERLGFDGNGCDTCNSGCGMGCCNAPCLFWTAGVEATFLKPNFKDSHATAEVTDLASARDCFFSTNDNDIDSLYVAPRIWLGIAGCRWGADVKYWQMRAGEDGYDPSLTIDGNWSGPGCGVPDIGEFTCNGLNLYDIDLEVSRRFCLRDDWMQVSMGVRHAEIRRTSSIVVNSDLGDTNLIGYGRDESFAQGTGLLFGLYGRRPIFPCSCINWYYNLHYSVLWGPTCTSAETAAQIVVSDPGSAGSTNLARTHSDGTLLIGEAQLGLEWDYALKCLPANAFFRAGIEFQDWDGGHGSSSADSFAGTTTTVNSNIVSATQGTVTANASEPRLDLFGFTLGTGLTW